MKSNGRPAVQVYETVPRLVLAWADGESMVVLDTVTEEQTTMLRASFSRMFRAASPETVGLLIATSETAPVSLPTPNGKPLLVDGFLTIKHLAALAGVSSARVHQLVRDGSIGPTKRFPGSKSIMVPEESARAFLTLRGLPWPEGESQQGAQ